MKIEHKESAKRDFVTSLIICIGSIIIFGISAAMPKFVEWGLYATPSLAPMIFSIALFLCGLIMLIRSIVLQGYRISISNEQVKAFLKAPILRHFLVALGLVILFYALFRTLNFILVGTIYLLANMMYHKSMAWWKILILSVIYTAAIYVLFNYVFFIPVP